GIAKAENRSQKATAETVIKGNSRKDLLKKLSQYLKNFSFKKLVIGLPLNEDMSLTSEAFFIINFVKELKKEVKADTVFVDEYASSAEALERNQSYSSSKRKKRVDHIAAKILLEQFLRKEAVVISFERTYKEKQRCYE
ncbi:MAG: Holliday junction resolvase RuvX, partial [Candidatus Dadabacteria bacterium]